MFVVLLKFSANKAQARHYMGGHNEWLKHGYEDGVFLLSGSIQPGLGGAVLAYNISLTDLQSRVNDDPFVAANIVVAEIVEITPGQADERFAFLLNV